MSKKKLLGLDIDELINESLRGLLFEVAEDESSANMKEKLKQQEKMKKSKDRKSRMKGGKEDAGDEGEESAVKVDKPVKIKHEKVPEVNAQSIADKINALRAGKSLKDKETMNALKAYFEKLNGPERIALFAFLSGLAKVLGDLTGDVKTPHSKPFSIDMAKGENNTPGAKGKDVKAQPKGTKEISKTSGSETPIVVGESADKRAILNVIKRNRRR